MTDRFAAATPVRPIRCSNGDCGNPAAAGENLCEACEMERLLYRRDDRRGPRDAAPAAAARIESAPR
jgi:hypothetical protein